MGTEPYQIAQTLCTIIFTLSSIWATRPEDLTPNFFPQRLPRTREIRQLGEAGDEEHRA
jgi:hypothetical protein